jgi:SAM-dependent methyltransferase
MNTDIAWARWGAMDPYFGVLSDPRYRRPVVDLNLGSFFESGERHVGDLLCRIERAFAPVERRRALDFGCGVGRLAIPLARQFDAVTGVDVSAHMLAEARRNAICHGQDNIDFVASDDRVSQAVGAYDFVNSYIVFQHIPVDRGMAIIRNLIAKVSESGVISLHVCVSNMGGLLVRTADLLKRRIVGAIGIANICAQRPVGEPMMQMNSYDLSAVAGMLSSAGFGPMLVEMEQHGRYMTANIISRRQLLS